MTDSPPKTSPAIAEARDTFEEGRDSYYKGEFHPVRLDEIYNGKYKVLRKLGYGQYSTVWLVRHQKRQQFWAMKVLSAECYGAGHDTFELEILQHLREADTDHPGYKYISRLEDSFTHKGPNGSHVCLIFPVMGETLASFQSRYAEGQIPKPLVAQFAIQLLQALDYAHAHGVIHTDIQFGNIMIQIPDETVISKYLENTHPARSDDVKPENVADDCSNYTIVPTQPLSEFYLDASTFNALDLNIALSDWGVSSWTTKHLTELIQPEQLRAPEVILKAPWGPSTDIWNLGALVPEMVYGMTMFHGKTQRGVYDEVVHLEEMNRLLGSFPKSLLERGEQEMVMDVFNRRGDVKRKVLRAFVGLDVRFADLEEEEREKFMAFTRAMLTLDTDRRKSAKELLDEPWLHHDWWSERKGREP